jgi:hypothetical protein
MIEDYLVGQGEQLPITAVGALDAWLPADAVHPFIFACRRIPGLALRGFPPPRKHILPSLEQATKQSNLVRGGTPCRLCFRPRSFFMERELFILGSMILGQCYAMASKKRLKPRVFHPKASKLAIRSIHAFYPRPLRIPMPCEGLRIGPDDTRYAIRQDLPLMM